MVLTAHNTAILQLVPDVVVEFSPGLIIGSDNERTTRAVRVVPCDGIEALVPIRNLVDATLILKLRDSLTHSAVRQIVDDLLQARILLPNDLIELRRTHPSVLKLFEWPTCIRATDREAVSRVSPS